MNLAYVRRARDGRFKIVIKDASGRRIVADIVSFVGSVQRMIHSYNAMIADRKSSRVLGKE